MLATCVHHRSGTFDMQSMGGWLGRPGLAGFFVAASMASIGLPGFGNFWGEFTIFSALAENPATQWILVPSALGIIISAIYGLRAVANIFFGEPSEAMALKLDGEGVVDLKASERLPASVLLLALLVLGLFPRLLSDFADRELAHIYPEPAVLPVHEMIVSKQAVEIHSEEGTH